MLINATSPAGTGQAGALGLQDFLKILLTQLTYQDPLKPMDNQEFLAQMAQFTALQQTQAMSARMDQLASTQSSLQSVGLLNRTVDVSTDAGVVSGTVTALSMIRDTPQLTLTLAGGQTLTGIGLAQVQAVR
jgi:flagellar basal-body rod modification protein FlgD